MDKAPVRLFSLLRGESFALLLLEEPRKFNVEKEVACDKEDMFADLSTDEMKEDPAECCELLRLLLLCSLFEWPLFVAYSLPFPL